MVLYEVTTTVAPDLVQAFERYMCDEHIPGLLRTGCFRAATFSRGAAGRYRMWYEAESERDIERYLAEHAPRLRAEFGTRFPGVAVTSRETWLALGRWDAPPRKPR